MTLETPVQQVKTGSRGVGPLLVLAVCGVALLVWHPWSAGGGTAGSAAQAPTAVAPASPSPVPSPALQPRFGSAPQLPEGASLRVPTVDVFRPVWSVVGVEQLTPQALWIVQLPIPVADASRPNPGLAETCAAGSGAPHLPNLPDGRLLLIGIAAPAQDLGGATEVVRQDSFEGLALAAAEVRLDPGAGEPTGGAAVRLFAQQDLSSWPAGAYRFDTADARGSPRFLSVCLASMPAGHMPGRPAVIPT